jgi:tetratricopeptide (TPR) repeat protein
MYLKTFLISAISLIVGGCSITGLESSFKADTYFSTREYQRGISIFTEKVRTDPDNALDNFYLGRFYLAENMPHQALPYLHKAVVIKPGDTDYQFWLGVASGAAGDEREERRRYERVLQLNSSHAKARLYLAHLHLKEARYAEALELYDKTLKQYPYNAAALYNRALSLKFSGQKEEERQARLEYLKWYPSGFLASKAADHLNMLGDFSYRNHQFGYRTVTLKAIKFAPGDDTMKFDSRASMRLVGAVLSNFAEGDLQITVFYDGNRELARKRALNLKNFLLQEYPRLDGGRIRLSWFAAPETLYGKGKKYLNKESVRIYMTNQQ